MGNDNSNTYYSSDVEFDKKIKKYMNYKNNLNKYNHTHMDKIIEKIKIKKQIENEITRLIIEKSLYDKNSRKEIEILSEKYYSEAYELLGSKINRIPIKKIIKILSYYGWKKVEIFYTILYMRNFILNSNYSHLEHNVVRLNEIESWFYS